MESDCDVGTEARYHMTPVWMSQNSPMSLLYMYSWHVIHLRISQKEIKYLDCAGFRFENVPFFVCTVIHSRFERTVLDGTTTLIDMSVQ